MIALAFVALGLVAFAGQPDKDGKNTTSVKVNVQESTIKWHATKVTGEHFGNVQLESGDINIQGNVLAGGQFTVDMSTLIVTDLDGEYKTKLEGHLKSDDFFSTERNKTAFLKIKTVSAIPGAKPGSDNYMIVADLTIKGITKEISFPAMVVINKEKIIANVSFKINRAAFDIRYGSRSFFEGLGDKAIDDDFNLKVRLVANR